MNTKKVMSIIAVIFALFLIPSMVEGQTITPITTVKSGNWSDTTVWNTGTLPQAGQFVTISANHVVTINVNSTVTGLTIQDNGELRFSPNTNVTLNSTANIVVNGKLTAKPNNASIVHTIKFLNINESAFVGGGMTVLDSDIGLWVMDGQLDIAGTKKTSWLRAAGEIPFAATQITLETVPVGWRIGDTISIAPTEPLSKAKWAFSVFDIRTITGITDTVVSLSAPVERPHPVAVDPITGNIYTAEVFNLTRNVRIEGTGDGNQSPSTNGRAHIFIHSNQPQNILYMVARFMGPRKFNSEGFTSSITGRYGLHFHMSGDGSRGSLVEGVVVRDTGGHAFVPHASHGITFKDTISFNTYDDAYWWDAPECVSCGSREFTNDTHDLLIDHAAAVYVRTDPVYRGYRLTGFLLRGGNNLVIKNSVAVGVQGNREASGFGWPEQGHAVWDFSEGNIAHNNVVNGIFVWQNDELHHEIKNFVAYNNGNAGIDHGAYNNVYQYENISTFGNKVGFVSRATTNGAIREDGYGMAIENLRSTEPFVILEHTIVSSIPVLVFDCTINGVIVNEETRDKPAKYDFVLCEKPDGTPLSPNDFTLTRTRTGDVWRIQNADGTAYQITPTSVIQIEPFYTLPEPPLSALAQQVKDILDAHPEVRQELIDAGVIQ